MKETLEILGGITAKEVILYGIALLYIYKVAVSWYHSITKFHDKQQETESTLSLAKDNRDKIDLISEKIDKLIKEDREYKLRSLGDKLFVCYNQAILQGYITRRQLENFEKNEKLYLALGGNGIVEDKYHPEIMGMRVVEDVAYEVPLKRNDEMCCHQKEE